MTKFIRVLSIAVAAASPAVAATINWSALDAQFRTSAGTPLADGSRVLLGTFNTSGAFSFGAIGSAAFDTYVEVLPFFTVYDSASAATVDTFGGYFEESAVNIQGQTGASIYVWAFNSATPEAATEWAIVGGNTTQWLVPADPVPGTTGVDIGISSRVIRFGSDTGIRGFGGEGVGTDVATVVVAVPEPSAAAALAGFVTLGFAALRRRRRSV